MIAESQYLANFGTPRKTDMQLEVTIEQESKKVYPKNSDGICVNAITHPQSHPIL